MRKITIGFILFLCLLHWQIQSANVMKIETYQVSPNTVFAIQLVAENTAPFVAFQVDIPIPAGFTYKDGSAKLNDSRASGHALSISLLEGNTLRLIGYSVGNTAFLGNAGSLASFSLKSGSAPATYALALNQAVLSDSQSNNILTNSTNGSVTVQAPNVSVSASKLDYGRVALGTTANQSFQITNTGNSNLTVSSLNFNDSQFTTTTMANLSISPQASQTITVKFTPSIKGTFAKQLTINSNDPDQPTTAVSLNAVAYAVNEVHTGSITGASSTTKTLEFTLNNMEAFTGFQFDLNLPTAMTAITDKVGTPLLFRAQDHKVTVSQINANTLRVIAFSAGNMNFTGSTGKVLSLDFLINGVAGNYSIGISNVIIANTAGENIVSDSRSGQLIVTSPDIDAPTTLSFGDVSILSKSTLLHRIRNYGQEPLIISQLAFSNEYFKSTQTLPVTIQPSGYLDVPIEFAKTTKGSTTATLKISSNDPDENPFTVQLSGNAFTPNYVQINAPNFAPGESKTVAVEVQNEEPFTAFQFDLSYPDGFTPDLNAISLTDRKQDHALVVTSLSSTSLRVLVYSLTQKAFTGKSGSIVNIPFKAEANLAYGTHSLTFNNVVISNSASENILYASQSGILNVQQNKILNISAMLQGLYNGNGTMRQAMINPTTSKWSAGVADYITVELHDAITYTTIVYSVNAPLSVLGTASISIPSSCNGSYYITIKHRSSLETTTATAISFVANTVNQSFLDPLKVYGNNLLKMNDNSYAIFGGDFNQDGFINTTDRAIFNIDLRTALTGYNITDLNGDSFVNTTDRTFLLTSIRIGALRLIP